MQPKGLLKNLKAINFSRTKASLIIVNEYKEDRVSHYGLRYVNTSDPLKQKLRKILLAKITEANSVEAYDFDSPEPEEDRVLSIDYSETDFEKIYEQLDGLNSEEDVIEKVEDLSNAKAYMILLRNGKGEEVIGFKKIPESWKPKRERGLISILFRENRFEDLGDENVFSISNTVEMFYFQKTLFILSIKAFEQALNFREKMMNEANDLYTEVEQLNLFINLELLKGKVGNNQRYLRQISIVKKLGHYQNPSFLSRMNQLNKTRGWNINFQNGQIVFTEDTIDPILSILQNKRLHSEFTNQDFDVSSAKPIL